MTSPIHFLEFVLISFFDFGDSGSAICLEHAFQSGNHSFNLLLIELELLFHVQNFQILDDLGGSPSGLLLLPWSLGAVLFVLLLQSFEVAEFIGVVVKYIRSVLRGRSHQLD